MSQPAEPNLPKGQDEFRSQSLDVMGKDILNSVTSWSLFWKPHFLAASSALVHVPFLFWLVEAHAPTRVVQLGVDDGVAYQAVCQAIDKLGLDAVCTGISLPGKQEANPDAIANNDSLYGAFSILTTEKLATAHRHFSKGSIDLLLINMPLNSESAEVLGREWAERLSDRAVIVIFDCKRRRDEEGAATWLDPLLATCQAIELEQGDGLLVLTVGPRQDGRIARLADLEMGGAGYREAREVFQRQGESLAVSVRQAELEADRKSLAEALQQLERTRNELDEAHREEETAHRKLASVQANHFDLEVELRGLQARLSEADAAVAKAEADRADLDARLATAQVEAREAVRLRSALAAEAQELGEFKAKYWERLADIAELGHNIARQDKEIRQLRAQREEAELRRHIQAQLAGAWADLHAALSRKQFLRPNKRAMNRLAEDIRLVEASDLFDAEWYLAFYPDVAEAGCEPARHFVTNGAYELRNPGPRFDSFKYHKAHADVTAARMAGFIHYVRNGRAENRQAFPVGERG
ncbi:hypothetical protein D2V17_13050 [Aurantiacibacter xanthus]|uniref:Uncharacterized protein n=1 Tax=Aurantiacibacter xanthus TaxID=1784712 RepID=A0A3A1P251_9SPHN|nr:class I SAM-dependent methyltransferase [Aurantiacibacter xanthus]RIV83513.1 hypothetical protein D2V17_13050 [Aurantiacibacter xanthus]